MFYCFNAETARATHLRHPPHTRINYWKYAVPYPFQPAFHALVGCPDWSGEYVALTSDMIYAVDQLATGELSLRTTTQARTVPVQLRLRQVGRWGRMEKKRAREQATAAERAIQRR